MKLGDAVAVIAKPIARRLDYTIGPHGAGFYSSSMETCQGCHGPHGRQARLNQFGDALYNYFWKPRTSTMEKLEYIMTVTLNATDPYDPEIMEIVTFLKSKGCSVLAINPRPPSMAAPVQQKR